MFNFFKKKPKTPIEDQLELVKNTLFPVLQTEVDPNGNKYHIDSSLDVNLDAVIVDLEEGHNDEITRKTIKEVADRIFKLREVLYIDRKISSDVKYLVVESAQNKTSLEDIKIDEASA